MNKESPKDGDAGCFRIEAGTADCAAPLAAELELFPPGNLFQSFSRLPIRAQVSFGEQDFFEESKPDIGFRLQFRRAILEVRTHNIQISPRNRYEWVLPKEQFQQLVSQLTEKSGTKDGLISGGVSGAISRLFEAFGAEVKLSGQLAGSIKQGEISKIEGARSFSLVRYVASGRWEIGHSLYGDPKEIDGLLRGSYVNIDDSDEKNGELFPICHLENCRHDEFRATVELRSKFMDCVYTPLGKQPRLKRWQRMNRDAMEKQVVLLMLREENQNRGLTPPDGEVVLARATLTARRTLVN